MDNDLPKVLIIDDTPANVDLLRSILSPLGYKISFAYDGERALKIVPHFMPDLILLDVNLPGADGFTICEKLKSDELTRRIPIIFVTGRVEMEALARGFKAGGIDYITKPIQEIEVLSRVKTQIALQVSRKRETRLQEEKKAIAEYNDLLLNSVANGIFSLDQHGKVQFVNPAGCEILGWEDYEIVGQDFVNLLDLSEAEPSHWEEHEIFISCSAGNVHEQKNATFARKSGCSFLVQYTASPLPPQSDGFNGAVVIFRDITEEAELGGQVRN